MSDFNIPSGYGYYTVGPDGRHYVYGNTALNAIELDAARRRLVECDWTVEVKAAGCHNQFWITPRYEIDGRTIWPMIKKTVELAVRDLRQPAEPARDPAFGQVASPRSSDTPSYLPRYHHSHR